NTFICTGIERDFISKIGAGCSAPVACNAVIDGDNVVFRTMIGFSDGTNIMQEKMVKKISESQNMGTQMAELMINNGALDLLKRAEEVAFKDEMPQRL
ncbi:MAG: hydroxymethylbilane synthase, partial [Campylobacterales bacterium]|nr:hydroxymethylbilane synthase [Campylobacterales bacterium]